MVIFHRFLLVFLVPGLPSGPSFRENHDHLLFVSYPCGFAKFASRNFEKWPETLESGHLVQCFNIVHLF